MSQNADAAELAALERKVLADPDDLRAGAVYRQAAIAASACDRAIDLFERLAAERPDSRAVHLNLGYAYVDEIPTAGVVAQALLARQAVRQFSAAVDVAQGPDDWLALYTRGNSYVYWPPILGRTRLAVADLTRAVETSEALGTDAPAFHAHAYASLGDAHWRTYDPETARACWRRGAERFPHHPALTRRLELDDDALDELLTTHYASSTRVDTSLEELWAADAH